jgi:exopolysaccharide biosynthesis polyprenyl glycosylphosphotransferase
MILSSAQRRRFIVSALQVADLAVVAACLIFALVVVSSKETSVSAWFAFLEIRLRLVNVLFGVTYVLLWNPILRSRGLYQSQRLAPTSREAREIGIAVLIGTIPLLWLRGPLALEAVGDGGAEVFGMTVFVALVLERRLLRAVARQLRLHGRNLRQVLFIGSAQQSAETATVLERQEALGYRVVSSVDTGLLAERDDDDERIAALARVEAILQQHVIDEVFVAVPLARASRLVEGVISLCEQEGVTVRVMSQLPELQWGWASVDSLMDQPVITISSTRPDLGVGGMLAKRVLDVVVSTIALVLLAPVLAVIAIAIKLDSRGPVLFLQERVGLNRRRFNVLKFRTMIPDAEARQAEVEHLNEAEGPVFKIEDDPRITPLGGFLRRTSLDEIPQLVNVLRGEMSLVGPRPLPVRDYGRIETRWHRRRFSVKPGITCLWQIRSREPKFNEWIQLDMEYIDNWSLTLDLKILAKTIPAVLSRHGAH